MRLDHLLSKRKKSNPVPWISFCRLPRQSFSHFFHTLTYNKTREGYIKKLLVALFIVAIYAWLSCFHSNRIPEQPAISGPHYGWVGEETYFVVTGEDIDDDSLAFLVSWGDNTYSSWTGYFAISDSVSVSHAYASPFTYYVQVQAQDQSQDTSVWSDPCSVEIFSELHRKWTCVAGDGTEWGTYPCAFGHNGTVYAVLDGALVAVDCNGTVLWKYTSMDDEMKQPSIGETGTVYSGHGNLMCAFNPDGTLQWTFTADDYVTGAAIARDGSLYFGARSKVYALNPDGSFKWSYVVGSTWTTVPILGIDGTVYFGADDGYYYAITPAGSLSWCINIDFWSGAAAIGADGTIYVPAHDKLYAISSAGQIQWSTRITDDPPLYWVSPVIDANGTIYVSADSTTYALSSDGTIQWQYHRGCALPSLIQNNLCITAQAGTLYTIRLDGRAVQRTRIPQDEWAGCSPIAAPNGTIYDVGDTYPHHLGTIFAFEGTSPLASSPWPTYQHDVRRTGQAQ